jgi:hypothetical protein
MVNSCYPSAVAAYPGAVIPGNSVIRVNDPSCSDSAKTNDNLWLNKLNLLPQIADTGILFLIQRIPISGWAAFHNIGDVAIFAVYADDREHIIQEFTCSAHKGFPLQILLLPRSFTDKHYIRIPDTNTEDNIISCLAKSASGTTITFVL